MRRDAQECIFVEARLQLVSHIEAASRRRRQRDGHGARALRIVLDSHQLILARKMPLGIGAVVAGASEHLPHGVLVEIDLGVAVAFLGDLVAIRQGDLKIVVDPYARMNLGPYHVHHGIISEVDDRRALGESRASEARGHRDRRAAPRMS